MSIEEKITIKRRDLQYARQMLAAATGFKALNCFTAVGHEEADRGIAQIEADIARHEADLQTLQDQVSQTP